MKKMLYYLIILICACSWRSPNSHFYMMRSHELKPLSDKKLNIAVAKIKVPDLLNREQIVIYEKDGNQIQILEFHRWGEILPDVLQSTVVNDLISYLPQAFVKCTYFGNQNAFYNINIEVNNLKTYRNDKVFLSVWWNITDSSGKILVRQQKTYATNVIGNDIRSLVDAQSQSVHLLSQDIAEQLLRL